jgi:hypothetical protein
MRNSGFLEIYLKFELINIIGIEALNIAKGRQLYDEIKTLKSKVTTTRFWNNLHQGRSKSRLESQII